MRRNLAVGVLLIVVAISWATAYMRTGLIVRNHNDTISYRFSADGPFSATLALKNIRPPVYPMMMRAARAMDASYSWIPFIQHGLFSVAALVLFFTMLAVGFKPWEALLIAGPVPHAAVLAQFGTVLIGEVISVAFAILAIAATTLIAAKGPSLRRNSALALSVALAVLTRPSFLFLVVMCPLAIALATPCFRVIAARRDVLRELVPNVTAAMLPLFLYALLRLAVVGHFGIAGFEGITLAGFGTNPEMLTAAAIPRLETDDAKSLARDILAKRKEVAVSGAGVIKTVPWVYDEKAVKDSPQFKAWVSSYDPAVWNVAVPAAIARHRITDAESILDAFADANSRLSSLSRSLLLQQPGLYVRWIVTATGTAWRDVFHSESAGRWAVGLTFCLIVLICIRNGVVATIRGDGTISRSRRYGIVAFVVALTLAVLLNFENISNAAPVVSGLIRGPVLGSIFPLSIMLWAFFMCARRFVTAIRERATSPPAGIDTAAGYASILLLQFALGAFLVVLVEQPLARYLIALSPLMPGAVLLLSVKVLLHFARSR